jgi:hypothetical protein
MLIPRARDLEVLASARCHPHAWVQMLGLGVRPGIADDVRGLLEYILVFYISVSFSHVISYVQSSFSDVTWTYNKI